MSATESTKGGLKRRLAHKALMPIVATAASAAAGYAAKKGPDLFEEKVLPKLKQTAGGAGDLAERAKDAMPLVGSDDAGSTNSRSSRQNRELSADELARHVRERADARAARRKAVKR
jgi:hypothetical protein